LVVDSESPSDAEQRIERVLAIGFMPFCQLYQPDEGVKVYPEQWRNVRCKWSRPAAYMVKRGSECGHNVIKREGYELR